MSQDKRDKIMDALNLLDDDIAVETMEARDKGQAGENRLPAANRAGAGLPAAHLARTGKQRLIEAIKLLASAG